MAASVFRICAGVIGVGDATDATAYELNGFAHRTLDARYLAMDGLEVIHADGVDDVESLKSSVPRKPPRKL